MGNNKDDHVAARRREILDAARKVFDASGYQATTIDEVALAAGVAKGSIYNYFPSKHELFKQVFMEDQTIRDYQAMLAAEGSVTEKLELMLDSWFLRLAEQQRTSRLMLEYWATAAREGREGEMTAAFQRTYRQWREFVTDLIRQGIASAEFSGQLDPFVTASLVIAMVDGLGLEAMLNVGLVVDEQVLAWLKRSILAVLAPLRSVS